MSLPDDDEGGAVARDRDAAAPERDRRAVPGVRRMRKNDDEPRHDVGRAFLRRPGNVERVCLRCDRAFVAPTLWFRLCGKCRLVSDGGTEARVVSGPARRF